MHIRPYLNWKDETKQKLALLPAIFKEAQQRDCRQTLLGGTNMASPLTQTEHDASQSKKAAASGWIGSALEYYDFFIYATAASLVFPQIFFPSENPTVAIIASLATYGVGYVARPIGAFVLGHWGDTHGRKTVLLVCMFLMGVSTMAVGILPTYQQVGVLAPVLLVILRLIQGFAVAGEISGASSMILEHAPFGRRGLYASFTLQGGSGWPDSRGGGFPATRGVHAHRSIQQLGLADTILAELLRHSRWLYHPPGS
jgi:Major Facilitator Superfamily